MSEVVTRDPATGRELRRYPAHDDAAVERALAGVSWVSYQPLGVVFAVMPWKLPVLEVLRFACAALAAGNAALLKHSPDTTGYALAVERCSPTRCVHQRPDGGRRMSTLNPGLTPGKEPTMTSSPLNEFGITHLRHVDLAVPDYETQRTFYRDTWGLTEVGSDGGLSYLAAEGSPERYVIRLRKADEKRLDLISFGAADETAVDALAEKLGRDGIQLVSRPDKLQTAGAGYGFRFFDIDGRTIEVSAGVESRPHRRIEEGEAIPVRISHAVMNSNDPNRTRDFYQQHLGFQLSDSLWSRHMGEMMHFLRCNDWHHSLAIARGPHTSVHHVSFEMRGLDEYMRGTGRVMRAGIRKVWGPGRHLAGNNTFSYFIDPSGNTMEYTTELERLETDQWHPTLYDIADPNVQDQWGTADPMSELIAKESFNDPDRGVFVAPPV